MPSRPFLLLLLPPALAQWWLVLGLELRPHSTQQQPALLQPAAGTILLDGLLSERHRLVREQLQALQKMYQQEPLAFLQRLDGVLVAQQELLAAMNASSGEHSLLSPGLVSAMSDVSGTPFEPLLDYDYVLDADNYLEDFINATGILTEVAAKTGIEIGDLPPSGSLPPPIETGDLRPGGTEVNGSLPPPLPTTGVSLPGSSVSDTALHLRQLVHAAVGEIMGH